MCLFFYRSFSIAWLEKLAQLSAWVESFIHTEALLFRLLFSLSSTSLISCFALWQWVNCLTWWEFLNWMWNVRAWNFPPPHTHKWFLCHFMYKQKTFWSHCLFFVRLCVDFLLCAGMKQPDRNNLGMLVWTNDCTVRRRTPWTCEIC